MQLSQLIYEVGEVGFNSPRRQSDIKDLINRAQREIAQRRNWTFMHLRTTAQVGAGTTSADLGPNFKCLSSEKSPVSFTQGSYNLPVAVASREEIEGLGIWPWADGPAFTPTPGSMAPVRVVFLEKNGPTGNWTLNIPPQLTPTLPLVFNLSAFFFPADLVLGTDSTQMTNHGDLADAIINLAKYRLYAAEEPGSKESAACKQMYEDGIKRACYADEQQKWGGRTMRM